MILADPSCPETMPLSEQELHALELHTAHLTTGQEGLACVSTRSLMRLLIEIRRMRTLAMTRGEAAAAVWACSYALPRAWSADLCDAIEQAIGRLTLIEATV